MERYQNGIIHWWKQFSGQRIRTKRHHQNNLILFWDLNPGGMRTNTLLVWMLKLIIRKLQSGRWQQSFQIHCRKLRHCVQLCLPYCFTSPEVHMKFSAAALIKSHVSGKFRDGPDTVEHWGIKMESGLVSMMNLQLFIEPEGMEHAKYT